MDAKLALDKIKAAEAKTEEIIEQAKAEAQKIIRQAGLDQEKLIKNAQDKAKLEAQKLSAKVEGETQKELHLMGLRAADEIKALQGKGRVKIDQAIEFIKSKINL